VGCFLFVSTERGTLLDLQSGFDFKLGKYKSCSTLGAYWTVSSSSTQAGGEQSKRSAAEIHT